MKKKTHTMIIKPIPIALKREFHVWCVERGRPMSEVLIELFHQAHRVRFAKVGREPGPHSSHFFVGAVPAKARQGLHRAARNQSLTIPEVVTQLVEGCLRGTIKTKKAAA